MDGANSGNEGFNSHSIETQSSSFEALQIISSENLSPASVTDETYSDHERQQSQTKRHIEFHLQNNGADPRKSVIIPISNILQDGALSPTDPDVLSNSDTSQDSGLNDNQTTLGNDMDVYLNQPSESSADVSNSDVSLHKMSALQRRIYYLVEEPQGYVAKGLQIISYSFIAVLIATVCVQSLPQYSGEEYQLGIDQIFFPIETVITLWWTVELLARFYCSTDKLRFFTKPYAIIDLLTILPYFLIFVPDQGFQNFVRILRIVRIVKAIRLARYSTGMTLGYRAMQRSTDAIWMFFIFVLLATLISASLMYWIERGTWDFENKLWLRSDGTPSQFYSIPQGIYWAVVTLTTVGYGDIVPVTPLGKTIAVMTMFLSVLTIALPTSIIGSNFMAEWQIYQRAQLQKKMRKLKAKTQYLQESDKPIPKVHHETIHEQNTLLLATIAEIQEKLCDVNPTQYYQKYKETKALLDSSEQRIVQLQKEVDKWKREAKALLKFRSKILNSSMISPELDVLSSASTDSRHFKNHPLVEHLSLGDAPGSKSHSVLTGGGVVGKSARNLIQKIKSHRTSDITQSNDSPSKPESKSSRKAPRERRKSMSHIFISLGSVATKSHPKSVEEQQASPSWSPTDTSSHDSTHLKQ